MSSELNRREFLAFAATIAASLACSRAGIPIEELTDNLTSKTPGPLLGKKSTITPLATQSPSQEVAESTQTSTPEPTPTFAYPLFNEWMGLQEYDGDVNLGFTLDGKDYNIPIHIVWYRDDFTAEQKKEFDQKTRAGKGSGSSETEKYGNSLLFIHSGYSIKKLPLEGEVLRSYIEGSYDKTILDTPGVLEKMRSLQGAYLTFMGNAAEKRFQIVAVAKIPHDAKKEFNDDTKGILDVVIERGEGNREFFNLFKKTPGLLLTFCGWGPESASSNPYSPEYRHTYTKYVIGLVPVD